MKKSMQRLFSYLLVAVLLLSLVAPAIPVMPVSAAQNQAESQSDLRVGIISDVHVSYDYVDDVYGNVSGYFNGVQPGRFEKALRFFKSQGVDAVVVAGDLQEASGTDAASLDRQKDWLQTFVDIWFKVFTEKQGEEGYVEPIIIYGNHDSALVAEQYWPEEFGTYEDAFVKTVNGYSFVCAHNAKESYAAPLLEKIAGKNQDKPIFYVQHCPIYNTVPGSTGGYGVGYGQTGRANIGNYHNVVAFNGHTHAPLTDEKSIWQGDAGNEGQFTVVNTATINYSGLNNDDMSINSYAGNAQQTEHVMIMDVKGSEVSIDRYSLNDMTIDTATGIVSSQAVKIGETWSWDACDVTDRPYSYDNRVANANAPVFSSGAAITLNSITDTSVSVKIPTASLSAPAGFSDMIESYVLEACNPTNGEVEAIGRIATSYHVDDKADVYEAYYTVTVTGLQPGTEYLLKAYAQEFYKKRSEPLTLLITTTGVLSSYRKGDVNQDGRVDALDVDALQKILDAAYQYAAKPGYYQANGDVDMNGVNELRDMEQLQAILAGEKITYPESGDLMDLVTSVKLTGVSTSAKHQPVDYGTIIQNQVVRGDSNQAVKTWTTNYAYYPATIMYFDEPVDLSGYTHLSFDTLFENEYNLSDSYRKRWLSVSFISGDQEQIASYGSMNFDSQNQGWTTTTVALSGLKNIDLTAVTAIRFEHNFDYYEGRFDGVTEHAIYWDNFYGLVIEGVDSDILGSAVVSGGNFVYGSGYTNHTSQAVQSTGGKLDVTFATVLPLSEYAGFYVDMRTPETTTVSVQALDADGNVIGQAVPVSSCDIFQNKFISVSAFGGNKDAYVAGLRFTYTCQSLLLDNLSVKGAKDLDLIGTADSLVAVGDGVDVALILEGTNKSNNALYIYANAAVYGGVQVGFANAKNLTETPYIRTDLKLSNSDLGVVISLYNTAGEKIYSGDKVNAAASNGDYATYEWDVSDCENLNEVSKVVFEFNLDALGEVWIDNLIFCDPIADFFGASTGLIGPSAVQDGFICEIAPSVGERTNVLHWYSDPNNGSGTTSAWPGETVVSMTKDVLLANHNGYDTADLDYFEFTIKNVGNYVAFTFTFKDASGAELGSSNGEYRVSLEEDWTTYRLDLASAGLTADKVAKIASITMGWNWQYQNVNGSETKKVADIYIDNMGFRAYPEDSADMLDQIGLIRNSEWWWGGHNSYPDAGWLYQSDVTVDSDTAFMFYRGARTTGLGYSPRRLYVYFNEPISVDADWTISVDVINENFAKNSRLEMIGSDNKEYTCFTFSGTGTYKLEALVSSLITADGVTFNPATTTIKGLKYHTNYNPDSTVVSDNKGYLVLDNLEITAPVIVPTVSLDGLDIIDNAQSITFSNSSVFGENFVFELLEQVDGKQNVIHMYADPAASGGLTTNTSYYYGPNITLSSDNLYTGAGVDYVELKIKNTNLYCDNLMVEVLNSAGTSLGKVFKRMATTNDWSYYRLDLGLLGLTEEELATISMVKVAVNWSKQYIGQTTPLVGEVYIDDITFGSYVDDSTDLFDHVASLQNVEWWWSGNNYYADAGWLMEKDSQGSSYFTTYRGTELDANTGYSPRRQYLYFDAPITLDENFIVSIHVNNSNMSLNSKISLLGDDGNKYGYLLLNQTGENTYELSITEFMKLNADTHMTATADTIDVSSVKIIGVILHNDFFGGDKTYEGSMVMDDLRIYDPNAVVEPEEPDVPEVNEPDDGDLLYQAFFAYNKDQWTDATGLSYAKDTVNVYHNRSVQSWAFHATQSANIQSAVAQLHLDGTYDMTDCYLVFEAKYVSDSPEAQSVGVRLHKSSWGNQNDVNVNFTMTAGDWNTYVLDFTSVLLSSADTTDLALISFYFNFANNTGYTRDIYIDNVRLITKETVEKDWINMNIDGGMSENVTYKVTSEKTYGDSVFAMKVETGSGYRITFNTQLAVMNGMLPGVVDMTKGGLIGGYFYFGDQTPSAKIRLTDKNWNGGASLDMTLIDVGDGWYYGYIDVANLYFYAGANNPTKAEIIRVSVVLPSNYTVYIDQLTYPAYIPADLVDYRVVYNADGSQAVASDVVSRLENDLGFTVGIVPDTLSAVENEIVLGSAARENETVAAYLTGGEKELGEFDYVIVVDNGKIYLVANTNAGIYMALDHYVKLAFEGEIEDGIYFKAAYDTSDEAQLKEGSDIRVMSYNVLYSTEYLVEDRIGNFLNIMGYYRPDVVGLQETSAGSNGGWHEYIQDALVADGIYLKACYASDAVKGLMTTFLYNPDTVKLIEEYVLDLEEGSQIRVLAVAVFERLSDGQRFVVMNTHPAPYGSVNYNPNLTRMLELAKAELAKHSDLPVMIVGDFNTEEDVAEYQTIMTELGLVDTKYTADLMVKEYDSCPGYGVSSQEGSDFVIDHIFANKLVDTKLYNIVIDHDVEHTSDHIPLYVDVKISGVEAEVCTDDMLHGATAADKQGYFSGDPYYYDNAATFVNGSSSGTSFMLGSDFGPNDTQIRWPSALIQLSKNYDLTSKNLVFDIYFDLPANQPIGSIEIMLYNSDWSQVTDSVTHYFYTDGWHTITLDATALLKNGCDLTSIRFVKVSIPQYVAEGQHRAYMDNMHLVTRDSVNLTTEKESDLLASSRIEWNAADWDGSPYALDFYNTDEICGENSWYSKKFSGTGSGSVQINVVKTFDLTGKDLVFDVKFVNSTQSVGINLWNNWSGLTSSAITKVGTGSDGWQTMVISASDIKAVQTSGVSMDSILLIQFVLNFASEEAGEHAVYIDNLRVVEPGSVKPGDITDNTDPDEPVVPDVPVEPEKDEDFLYNATIANGEKQSVITNNSLISWKITPGNTGWSYPTFTLDRVYDISKYDLVMDIYPANMKNFRMHLATLDGGWISGGATYYESDKWTTVSFNLSANSAGLTEISSLGLGIDFSADVDNYALYIDNVRLVERKVNADATEESEKASDILAISNFEWSGSDWTGADLLSYSNDSDDTNGKDSLRSWRFSRKESAGAGYARVQIKLNQIYDMTNKDLVFDIKFDGGKEIASYNFGIILYNSAWTNIFPNDNYLEPMVVAKDGDWYTVRLDNSVLRAYLLEGKDLSSVYLLNFCFQFPAHAMDIYIDNMHLEDHVYGTDETDTAGDLLADATVVQTGASTSGFYYDHRNTFVAYGENSNASHKFYGTSVASGYNSVKYDLGKSYDLTGKNIVMDVFAFRTSTTFLFQLYDSQNNLITSAYRGCTNRKWSEVTPAILSNDLDLTDVRYIVIGAYFEPDSTLNDRAFYVDNVRIEAIDTYHTALENKNIVFIGDSITASGGYKGWSGELEEHYFINRYNIGAGGTSYANISGRGQIFSQTKNIPNVNVDYFVLNGGVNDIWSAWDLGSVSSVSVANATVDSFDTNTTAGGMEQMFCYLRTNYPTAKIAFIITYNCFDGGFDSVRYRDEFVPLAKAICDKWSVPYLDLVNNDDFNSQFNALAGIHTYDGVHANDIGYDLIMRELAPFLLNLSDATEQTEQNSDLLAYSSYEWSSADWKGSGNLSYDTNSDVTNGPDSLRSWKFSANSAESGWPAMQIKLSQLAKTSLTGKALQFDVKFEASNGNPKQQIGVRVFDQNWGSIIGNNVIWKEVSGSGWHTITISASEFEALMDSGRSLDVIYLLQFHFDFASNAGNMQDVYVDNVRIVDIDGVATDETEAASDLLYGAKYVSGSFNGNGLYIDQFNTMYVNGADSKYSLRMYADEGKTSWCNARFELAQTLDLRNKTLKFDVNQYQHVYIGVALYNSKNEQVTSDSFTIRNSGWQTFEVNLLGGLATGMTAEDLADIRYINFSSSFEYVKTGRILLVDNVQTYENVQYDTILSGLNGLYLGDSISEAISYKGWAGELAEHYGVNNYNVSVSGATLANNDIFKQLSKAPDGVDYDFVMLNGGVNDVWRGINLGSVAPDGTTEFDTTTAIGALEHLFATIRATYPDAEICYVLNYVCVQAGYPSDTFANEFAPLARAACEKWGVHCLDLVDNAEFNAEFDAKADVHTYDGVHANTEGYNVLTKYIAPWLESIMIGD